MNPDVKSQGLGLRAVLVIGAVIVLGVIAAVFYLQGISPPDGAEVSTAY
jgi:hypothetical protein